MVWGGGVGCGALGFARDLHVGRPPVSIPCADTPCRLGPACRCPTSPSFSYVHLHGCLIGIVPTLCRRARSVVCFPSPPLLSPFLSFALRLPLFPRRRKRAQATQRPHRRPGRPLAVRARSRRRPVGTPPRPLATRSSRAATRRRATRPSSSRAGTARARRRQATPPRGAHRRSTAATRRSSSRATLAPRRRCM